MKLKSGYAAEYRKRHDEIWPELSALLTEAGVSDYSIYLDEETNILFAFQRLEDGFDTALLPSHPIVKKWWAFMSDIMETNPDNSPKEAPLEEMFYMK